MFIIFNTVKQVENYMKRHPNQDYIDGCGCCWSEYGCRFDGKKIISYHVRSYAGHVTADATVIGRLKKR
jgi:hypothetical protein